MIQKHDRRIRRIWVSERDVLNWFTNAATQWANVKFLVLPTLEGLPKDVSVESVHHEPMQKCFWFVVHSFTFTEFPDGATIPDWEGQDRMMQRYKPIEIRTDADRWREKEEAKRIERQPMVFEYRKPSEEDAAALRKAILDHKDDRKMILMPYVSMIRAGVDLANGPSESVMTVQPIDTPMPFSTGFDCDEDIPKVLNVTIANEDGEIATNTYRGLDEARAAIQSEVVGGHSRESAKKAMESFGRFGPANVPYEKRPKGPAELAEEAAKPEIFKGGQPVFAEMTKEAYSYPVIIEDVIVTEPPPNEPGTLSEGQALLDFFKGP